MARTAKIRLEGVEYTIHAFNIGEMERIVEISAEGSAAKVGFGMLCVALERAEPRPLDPRMLEPTSDEIAEATRIIMDLAGLQKLDASPTAVSAA